MHLLTRLTVVAATVICFFIGSTALATTNLLPSVVNPTYSGANMYGTMNATQDSLIITVEVFYDCPTAASFPDTLIVLSNCGSTFNFLPLLSDGEISDVCATTFPICGSGTGEGERRIVYQGAVDITPFLSCNPATFRIYPYNRVDAENLNNPSATSDRMRVVMDVYFAQDSLNSLPVFGANGHPTFCAGTNVKFDPQVTDPDGDSLVFLFRQPQGGISSPTNISYATGYSLADPLGNGSSIDSETGILTFTVPDSGHFQVVIQVNEYDRATGNQIGMVFRDFQLHVDSACSNPPPVVASSLSNLSGATLTSNYVVTMDTGVAGSFDLEFTGGGGETVVTATTATSVLSGSSVSTSTSGNNTTVSINWTPTAADIGTHVFSISAEDDACDVSGKMAQKVTVIVQAGPAPFQITSITSTPQSCPDTNDGSIIITTTGGTGPYSFSIFGLNTISATQDSGTFLNIPPDFYLVNVGDSGTGFDTAFSVTVNPSYFDFLATPFTQLVNPSCDDACDGDARSRPNPFGASPYTYLWSNGETGVKAFNLCGGMSVVSITDANGCTIIDSVSLLEPPAVFAVLDSTSDVTCNGGNDGAAYVSGHGGTVASDSTTAYLIDQTEGSFEPYGVGESFNTTGYQTFDLGDDQLTASISLGFSFEFFGNSYTTFQISSNGIIQFPGATSGTWQNVAIPSATNPDNWIGVWDDLNPNATTNEVIETYMVGTSPNRVRVVNFVDLRHFQSAAALYTFQIVLYETSNIIQIHTTNVPNFAEGGGFSGATMGIENADGSIGYAVPGRNATNWSATNDYVAFIPVSQNFSYSWSSIGSGASATNLTAGNYTVTVEDGSCTDTVEFVINEPPAIVIDTTVVQPTCVGDSNGSITASASGGNGGPFSYIWSTGSTTATASNLPAGTYTVTATDAIGCTETLTITLTNPNPVVASINVDSPVSCFGGSDGQLTASASGGTPAYTYLWNGGATTPTISSLSAGAYTVVVTDGNGCEDSATVTLTDPPLLTISIASVTNVSCPGGNDGSITANAASGGTSPYSYSWTSGGTSLTESGLTAGTYTIEVTDGNGCTATADTVITEPASGVSISIASATNVTCNGDADGSITANAAAGGTSPYTYAWSSGGTSLTESGLSAGTYTIVVTDAGGCQDSADTTISEPTVVFVDTTSVVQPTCSGSTNGSITVTTTGGTPGYTYSWNTGATTPTISSLSAGTYTVEATDANGCTDDITIVLTDGNSITASIAVNSAIQCNGATTGDLTASGAGGTSPYSFNWSTSATTPNITNLAAGTYTVVVTDATGCSDSTQVTLTDPPLLTASIIDSTNVGCAGGADGDATAAGSGGISPYSFNWSNGDTTAFISGLTAGTYTVTVTDDSGCVATAQVNITEPATGLSVTVNTTDVNCFGGSDGTAVAVPGGGTTPYSYVWSTGATSDSISNLSAGTYSVTVTDSSGCTGIDSGVVNAPGAPVIAVTSTDSASCAGVNDGQIQAFLVNGTFPLTYNWSTGDTTQTVTGLGAGTYTVTVTDANGCSDSQTDQIGAPAAMTLSFNTTDPSCSGVNDGGASVTPTGGSSPYTYLWSNSATTDTIGSLSSGTYSVEVTDNNGCVATDSVTLTDGNGIQAVLTLVSNPLCNGDSTGSLAANATNTSLPFSVSYLWNTGSTSNLLFNIPAGTYTVIVTDNNTGCQDDTTVTLTNPPALTATASTNADETCVLNDGEVTVSLTNGTGPFNFVWSNGDTTQTSSGLAAGTYSVTVTDASGCIDTSSAVVADSCDCGWVATPIVIDSVLCNGDSTGRATVTHAGATPPVTYLWSTGSTNDTIQGLPAGTYTVTVTGNGGCADTVQVDITQPTPLAISGFTNISAPTCDDDCDGAATVNASGGAGSLTYAWSSGGTTPTVSGLCGGGHYVTVTDANGCTAEDVIALVEPPVIFASVDSTDSVNCVGGNDGAAFLSAHGGFASSTSTASYIIDQSEGSFEPYPTGRPWNAINYKSITLQDDAISDTINIFGGDNFSFFGVNHTHFVMNSQGFISFDLSNANSGQVNGQFSTTSTIPSSAAGTPRDFIAAYWHDLDPSVGNCQLETYLVGTAPNRIRVVNYIEIDHWVSGGPPNIISTFQIVLYENSNIIQIHSDSLNSDGGGHVQGIENFAGTQAYAVPGRNNTNFSASNDYVAFIPTTQNFTYTWSSIGSGPSDTTLTAGNYTVTVSDGACSDTAQFEIFEPDSALDVAMSATASFCFVATGTATANVSNGQAPYTYVWSNSTTNTTTSTSDTITGLTSGPYSVTVTDGKGCVDSNTIVVQDFFAPAVTALETDASCANACDGTLIASYTCGSCGPPEWFVFPDTSTLYATGDTVNNVCPETYLVRITTGFGCSRYDTVVLGEPTPMILTMDSTDAACAATANGSASVAVTGGIPPYSFAWSNSSTNDTITGLTAGVYTVTVTDSNGCEDSASVTVNQNSDVTAFATLINDASCNLGADGSAVATQTGGTGPYTYSWTGGSTNDTLLNVTAGTYIVTVTDSNGCFDTASVVIGEPDTIGFAFTETPISCGGAGNDGEISLSASGGTPGYTYLWNTGSTSPSITGLTAGTYCVTVTDANNCEDSACYVLDPPGGFTVAIIDSADILCFGDDNGYAVVAAQSGGSGSYTYLWDNGATTDTVNNLTPGTHSVTVTDAVTSCVDSASVNIAEPSPLTVVIDTVNNVTCQGGNDGYACGTVSGGTAPYTFAWSNGSSTCAGNLTAGTYTVTITDSNGCTVIADTVITEPAVGLSASASIITPPSCNGDSALVEASGAGGSGTYTFLWPNGDTTAQTLVPAGTYCVTVSDGGICQDTACVIVDDPSAITVAATFALPSCPGGSDGSLTATPSGGTPGYTYLWSTGSTNPTITGLSAGTYGLTITDANGCSDSADIILSDPAGMSANFTNINTSSCGTCNGSATVNVSGGAVPYTYNWLTGGSTSPTGTSLCAGLNEVEVTDNNGCIDTFSVSVPTLGADTVTGSVVANVSCAGGNDGAGAASYTCTVAPCTVAWYSLPSLTLVSTADTATGLTAGDYIVELTNDSGCVSSDTISITDPSPLVATITAFTPVSCPGGSDGTASVSGSGGTVGAGGYSFLWPSGNTGSSETGLSAGTYCVTVTDDNNCEDTACVIISEPSAGISVTATVLQDVSCSGGNDGVVTASGSNGTPPYTFTWNGTIVADTLFNVTAGTYIVEISDGGPCTASDTVIVDEPNPLTASFTNVSDPSCPGDLDGEATITASGGIAGYTYLWPSGNTGQTETGLGDGTYCVTVTDANNCQDTFCVNITDPSGISNTFTGITASSCTVCDGTATANPTGGNGTAYTYLWDNGQTTATNDSLCAGINNVTITDTAGCSFVDVVSINADSADTVVAGGISPSCGSCDGVVFATYNCTSAPCTVEWTDLATSLVIGTTDTIDSLCEGTYAVELTNAQGCVSADIISIDAPDLIDPNETLADASCFGTCDGSIALAPAGGSGTYTYTWNTGATSATVGGLCAGTYTVTISDGSGCDTTLSFDIDQPTEILTNATLVDASCAGECDGQINAAPTGGAGGYSFNWSPVPSNGNGMSLADSLCAGFYFLTITDGDGCTSVDTFTIFEPAAIVENSVTITDATCGDCDGEIDPEFGGGQGALSYAWSNGEISLAIDSLCFGFYDVTVTDAAGCDEVFGYPVSETGGPGISLAGTNTTANGACDGTATATVTSSLGTVTFVWSNGDNTATADSLCAGTYIVTATDTNGCSTVDTITIIEPSAMTLDFTSTEISCAGNGCDGSIQANVMGGVLPYGYAWSNGDTTAFINNLCAGTYVLTVTDSNGAMLTDSVTLTDPQPFNVVATVADVSCPGECDGSIDLAITNSGAPYTILWNTGDTTALITDLCQGTYSVTLSDTAGCVDSLSFDILEPAPIAITVDSLTNPDCQASNGMIAVTASGGNGTPYSYEWLDVSMDPLVPAQTTSQASGLVAGIYNVVITDSNGCQDTFDIILNNANAPAITLDSLQHVSCFGECDGAISTTISGGTNPYNILWSNGATTDDIDSLCAGSDTIAVIDANLCVSFEIFEILEPEPLNVRSLDVVDVTCGADCDGSIEMSIEGGTEPYTFAWSNGASDSSLTDLCAGTYDLTVTDANGCSLITSAIVDGPAPMVITLDSIGDATCTNTGDGFIHISMAGGSAPYSYQWTIDSVPSVTTQDINGGLFGNYILVVSDTNGCTVSDTFNIDAQFFVEATAQDDIEVCPQTTGLVLTGTQQGAASTRWLFANGTIAGTGTSLSVNTSKDTSMYVFEGINGVCVSRDTVYVTWTAGPGLDAGPDRFIEPGSSTDIGGAPTANAGVDVLWTPAKDITDVTELNPTVNPLETTTYYVSATDDDGCFGIDSVLVTVEEVVDPVGGFSPNNDGVNDYFVIDRIEDYPNAVVQIFNRWGNQIFQSTPGYTDPWDGTYQGKALTVGTYYYVIDLNDPAVERLITGPVTILK